MNDAKKMNSQKPDYIIVGLGKTGLSCATYLLSQQASFIIVDSRDNPPELTAWHALNSGVPVYCGRFSEEQLSQATALIVSPGVSLDEPAIKKAIENNVSILSDVALFFTVAKAPIIAVTGSNGKSTVVRLTGDVLNQSGKKAIVCGNVGLPVLDALQYAVPDYYVVELSSFQLAMMSACPAKISVLLNISEDHMDRHHDLADYLAAKQRVFIDCEQAIVNADEDNTWQNIAFKQAPITFSLSELRHSDWWAGQKNGSVYLMHHQMDLVSVDQMALKGAHNWQNMLVVLAIADVLGVSLDSVIETFKGFEGLPHRCQLISTKNGVRWVNDSKGTNVGATLAAITSLAGDSVHQGAPFQKTTPIPKKSQCVLIVGGDSKGADIRVLRDAVRAHVSHVFALGKDKALFENGLSDCAIVSVVDTIKDAVNEAAKITQPGDLVLLSPACASWDQYPNYEVRGNDFVQAVAALSSV